MERQNQTNQKKCLFCGRFFCPDSRVGNRQKSCKRSGCVKKRKQVQQKKWRQANPDYFRDRYEYLREWRKSNSGYQKQWRARKGSEIQTQIPSVSPIRSIRLNMRADLCPSEIQTLVLTLIKSGQALWINGCRMQPG